MEQSEILDALADVSEDLAIEILSSFDEEDYPHLGKSAERLIRAANILLEHDIHVPFSVSEVIRLHKQSLS